MSHITCCAFDDCLHSIGDDTREQILLLLRDREMSVNDIAQHFALTQPSISHHLAVLRHAHLMSTRRNGQQILYHANFDCVVQCCREICSGFGQSVVTVYLCGRGA